LHDPAIKGCHALPEKVQCKSVDALSELRIADLPGATDERDAIAMGVEHAAVKASKWDVLPVASATVARRELRRKRRDPSEPAQLP